MSDLLSSKMLTFHAGSGLIDLVESCGLNHELQVIEVPTPPGEAASYVDTISGAWYALQQSKRDPSISFLLLGLEAFQTLHLAPSGTPSVVSDAVRIEQTESWDVLANGSLSLKVVGEAGSGSSDPAGPLLGVRVGQGPWRGSTYVDSRAGSLVWDVRAEETGPVRVVYHCRADLFTGGWYEMEIRLDAGQTFARISEQFHAGPGDQLVWDFAGVDLPVQIELLNSDAGQTSLPLYYHFDQRIARLAGWTQYQQLFDLSDGFGLRFANSDDVIGWVSLEGGKWRGSRLNHLEAWTRRWLNDDSRSRRDVPSAAKCDSSPGPEPIPARGQGCSVPHLNLEGWIHDGRRDYALVATTADKLLPLRTPGPETGRELLHFEERPDRARYASRQGLLRRIHIQRGLMPLSDLVKMTFEWPEETGNGAFSYPNKVLESHFGAGEDQAQRVRLMLDYLEARVYGFWEGSGASYSNCVVGRRIAPCMYLFAAVEGNLGHAQSKLCRAWFSFLSYLFDSDNYYPGDASMTPVGSPKSMEPTMEGMANQNFYTDIYNVPGTAAQVFAEHPDAGRWREKFGEMWRRQLAYHVYPESGLWEESHTYYHHVLYTVLPTHLRRREDGVEDAFADPVFQRLVGSALSMLSPRDACYEGWRHAVSIGDHAVNIAFCRSLYAQYAEAFEGHNPGLAGQLRWAYDEMGGTDPCSVSPLTPAWKSEYVQGLGYMMRAIEPSGHQTLLALRCGSAWAHHHEDDGSIQFFARGRALVVDTAFSETPSDQDKKYGAAGHSRWSLKDCEPVNYLWRFNRGWISDFSEEGRFPYAVAYCPVFMVESGRQAASPVTRPVKMHRAVFQITPAAFIIVDVSDAVLPQVTRFHVPGTACELGAAGARVEYAHDSRLRIVPLIPRGLVPAVSLELPESPEKIEFATTELRFDIGLSAVSAYFLSGDEPQDPRVATEGGLCNISGEGFSVSLDTTRGDNDWVITLRDLVTNEHLAVRVG